MEAWLAGGGVGAVSNSKKYVTSEGAAVAPNQRYSRQKLMFLSLRTLLIRVWITRINRCHSGPFRRKYF